MADVSVIIPVKARDDGDVKWLHEAIQSVQQQSHKNWELVMINDHSPVSLAALSPMFKDSSKLRGATATGNGVSEARNQAVSMASSELILPLDADDTLPPYALEIMLEAWHKGGGRSQGIVYGDLIFQTQDAQRHFETGDYGFDRLLKSLFMPIGCLHRKSDWQLVGGWNTSMEYGLEDWDYWIKLGEHGVCGLHVPRVLYNYRRHAKGRLAYLRTNPEAWGRAYARLRSMHQDTFDGRLPMGCCGGSQARQPVQPAGVPAMMPAQQSRAMMQQAQAAGTLVPLEYVGAMQGFYVRGPKTGVQYAISKAGELVRTEDGKVGAHPADAEQMVRMDRGNSFRVRA